MRIWIGFLILLSACTHAPKEVKPSEMTLNQTIYYGKFSSLNFKGGPLTQDRCSLQVAVHSPEGPLLKRIPVIPGQMFSFSAGPGKMEFESLYCLIGFLKKSYSYDLQIPIHRFPSQTNYLGEISIEIDDFSVRDEKALLSGTRYQNQAVIRIALQNYTDNTEALRKSDPVFNDAYMAERKNVRIGKLSPMKGSPISFDHEKKYIKPLNSVVYPNLMIK